MRPAFGLHEDFGWGARAVSGLSQPLTLGDDIDFPIIPDKVGISYSGGGPLMLIELGYAKAFVNLGVVPNVISGVSAGAIAGTAHALDPTSGRGIALAALLLRDISSKTLGLTKWAIFSKILRERFRIRGLGDNRVIGDNVRDGIRKAFPELGDQPLTIGDFGHSSRPALLVGSTNRLNGRSVWFPKDSLLHEALIASSAIPGVFPWSEMTVSGTHRLLIDGGVVANQPVSELVAAGCGTVFSLGVGYSGGTTLAEPANAVDNVLPAIFMMSSQAMQLENAYVHEVMQRLGGTLHQFQPNIGFPVTGYNFSPAIIDQIMETACAQTEDWLRGLGYPKATNGVPPVRG